MKVLLLNPPPKRVSEKKDIPRYQHVGIGYLISALEQTEFPVRVIDAKLDRLGITDVLRILHEYSPDVLCLTSMTHEVDTAASLAHEYKTINPDSKTILGGVHFSALPEETLKQYPWIDAGIIGEGELTLPRLLKDLDLNGDITSSLPGVVFTDHNGKIRRSENEWIRDLNSLPFPGWKYFKNAKDYIIITSRGCPYSCIFCMQASGRVVRYRSPENIIEEIEKVLKEKKPEKFLFYDETFTLNRQRVFAICDLLIQNGLHKIIKWSSTTRVDAVNRDILLKMKEAGCNHIEFGIESGNEKILQRIKKNITTQQAERAVSLAKELNFHTEGAFILGHPTETMKTALETIDFAAKLNPDIIQLGIMVPYPGTEVRAMALKQEGGYRLLSNDWKEYNKQLGNALELDTLSRADLERIQLIGYLRLFIFNRRFTDLFKFIFNFRKEMISYLRNIFRRREKTRKSFISPLQAIQLIFRKSTDISPSSPR